MKNPTNTSQPPINPLLNEKPTVIHPQQSLPRETVEVATDKGTTSTKGGSK